MKHGGGDTLCGRWRGRTVHIVPMVGPGTCFGCLGRSFGLLAAVHGAVCDFATPAALCVVMVITDRYVQEYLCVAYADGGPKLPRSLKEAPQGHILVWWVDLSASGTCTKHLVHFAWWCFCAACMAPTDQGV